MSLFLTNLYNSVLTCQQNIVNSSASAPLNATKIAVKKVSDACSGRNYNFRCINVVFWRVFARVSAYRTNLSTNSGKATKRLSRLAPNLAHMCKFIWEWIYAKQIAPRDTRGGALGGFRGSTIQKSWEAVRLTPTFCGFIWE